MTRWMATVAVLGLLAGACDDDGTGATTDTVDAAGDVATDTSGDVATDTVSDAADVAAEVDADVEPDQGSDAEDAADTTSDADATGDAETTSGCPNPLDQETVDKLTISLAPSIDLQPGQTLSLSVGKVECCVFVEPVEDACVVWSIEPAEGVTLDADTGQLTVDADTPSGSLYTVTANVEDGRRILQKTVAVYTPEANPLKGTWREVAQLPCDGGEEVVPDQPIGELRFWAGGQVDVTWTPFEVYVDYWSDYTFDLGAGTLSMTVTGGNYTPDDLDLEGTFEMDADGDLILRDMWLGSPQGVDAAARCGHRFEQ